MNELARVIREWRARARLSLADAATLFGVNASTFSRWENEESKMNKPTHLARLEKLVENQQRMIREGAEK